MGKAKMIRAIGTTILGLLFEAHTKDTVWSKGAIIPGKNPKIWRRDKCRNLIKYSDYGNTNSAYGWEIDHIHPVAFDGTDDISNLQPLQWQNNRNKGDKLNWNC